MWLLLAILLVLFAVALSAMRYALPYVDHNKDLLENYVNDKYGVELQIGSVRASWEKQGPSIILSHVALASNDSSPVALEIDTVHMQLDFWESLRSRMLSSNVFTLESVTLEVDADRLDSAGESDFPVVDALKSLFLEQLQRFSLREGDVTIVRGGKREVLQVESLNWINADSRHQGTGAVRVKELANNSASFIFDLTGSPDELNGVLYAKAEDLDISPWVSGMLSTRRPLKESRANFEIWAEVQNSAFSALYTEFHDSKLAWGDEDSVIFHSGIRGGSIQALPVGDAWHFRVDQLIFDSNDQSLITDLVGTVNQQGDILVNTVKPAPVNPFLVLLPLFTDDTADDNVRDLNPTGELATLQLQWKSKGLELAAKLIDVSWQQDGKIPGFDAIDAEIYWHKNQGVVTLAADNAQLNITQLLPEDIPFTHMGAKVYIFKNVPDNNWYVQSDDLVVDSPVLSLNSEFSLNASSKDLSLRIDIAERPVKGIENLLPAPLMGTQTTAFLKRAIVGPGNIDKATILWQGKGSDFPFANNEGIFQTKVSVSDSTFMFSDKWPALEQLDLTLLFENGGLTMTSPGGQLKDIAVSNMVATIPAFKKQSKLVITAHGEGSGDDVAALMLDSSLSASLGRVLDKDVVVEGTVAADLHLDIPFDGSHVVASGTAYLNDNRVYVASTDMTFQHTAGEISFENQKINGSSLSAELLDQPVSLSFQCGSEDEAYLVNINLDGHWDAAPLINHFNPGYNDYIDGTSDWQAVVALRIPSDGFSYRATVSAPLVGLSSRLPAPLAKQRDETVLLNIVSEGDEQASTIHASLGDEVRFEGVLPHQEKQFSRAHLALGESDFVGMGIGFSVSATLDTVDTSKWYDAISLLINGAGESSNTDKPGLFSVPERVFITADNLIVAGQQLHNANVTAKQSNNDWLLEINAVEARASVNFYHDWLTRGVSVEADYLRFEDWAPSTTEASESWDADTLPPLYFHCSSCQIADKELGELTLDVAKADDGFAIRQFKADSKHGHISAIGKWQYQGQQNITSLDGTIKSNDVGKLLSAWGMHSGIKDSGASVQFDVNWAKSPMDFDVESLAGNVEWSLSDGYLSEVSDKGSRIFTIFSLNSLVRKLSLDFRDVFSKGFFYDGMSGSLSIEHGKAYTDDTSVDGGAGEMNINGYTDLVTSQLNYNVEFTPNVTGNLPILVYFLATPPTALAALALDKVLTSAKVISNVNYHVSGTLSEPVIEEMGRKSKEISLPTQTTTNETSGANTITEQGSKQESGEDING
ncbi:YhdP family protein [Alteromonas sp. C1M14]|uniref:YhdP family protein n=1 Tax=Alteromonas sp. C1M14 TaxID=2841567 RepID=UPI001C095978|nr:YhdP family protein [Alteromonas sp. C1M14]